MINGCKTDVSYFPNNGTKCITKSLTISLSKHIDVKNLKFEIGRNIFYINIDDLNKIIDIITDYKER